MMQVHKAPASGSNEMTNTGGLHCVGSPIDNVERVYYGARPGVDSDEAYHPFRSVHGMRSVVR